MKDLIWQVLTFFSLPEYISRNVTRSAIDAARECAYVASPAKHRRRRSWIAIKQLFGTITRSVTTAVNVPSESENEPRIRVRADLTM